MSQTGGHPKGLYVLFATEMWERFNYYGMRAILFLFMTKALFFEDAFASNLYGSYISLIYLTPLVGGYIADRYWGNKRSIFIGGLVMVAGEIILFACGTVYHSSPGLSQVLLYCGLGFMVAGNGFFKPNISSLVGQLYPVGDRRKDSAYTIFYMGINLGGAFGPLVCGLVGDTRNPADFKWAFLVGAIAMLLSLVVQRLYHNKYVLSPEGKILGLVPGADPNAHPVSTIPGISQPVTKPPSKGWMNPIYTIIGMLLFAGVMIGAMYMDTRVSYLPFLLLGSFLFIAALIFSDKSLLKEERRRVWIMLVVAFFVVFFWAAYEQTGASLTMFADRQTDLNVMGIFEMPASWFQSFNSIFIIIFALPFAWLWLKLGKYEPSTITKMAIGIFFLGLGYLWIAFGVKDVSPTTKVSIIWLTLLYVLHTWGELCLSPIGLSLFNKLAPLKFASLLMAVWFLGNAGGNKFAGVLSSLYPDNGRVTSFLGYRMTNLYDFFMLFVGMSFVAALILFLLSKPLNKLMAGVK